jgi:hemolysin D
MTVQAPVAPTPAAQPPARRSKLTPRDREFLPAALEILETPASPIRLALIILICAFVSAALVWSYFSRIDILAVAQGKLQPTGRVKVIQPLDTSRVLATKVENGSHVHVGDVLVELDPSEAEADVAGSEASLASYRAEALRRRATILAAQSEHILTHSNIVWPDDVPATIRDREDHVFTADLAQLSAQLESQSAQAEQKRAEHRRLEAMIMSQGDLIDTLQERVAMRTKLIDLNAGSKANLLDSLSELQTQKTTLAQQKGQLVETEANLDVISREMQRIKETFIAENAQKAAEAERQSADLAQKLVKAKVKLGNTTLRSPIDGTVQASALTTVGQIVASGEQLMRIVPEGETLEIMCYLQNRDIGFVKTGQSAVVKVESFPFTRYGTIQATVKEVARDAIPQPDADLQEKDSTQPARSTPNGAQRTQNLVFPVTLALDQTSINVDGTNVPLGAGMAVTVEIRTGSRRILEYLFSPLTQIASEAMKER